MNQRKKQDEYVLRDAEGNYDAPLLDRLMSRSNASLKEEGIDIRMIGQTNDKQKPQWDELEALYQSIAGSLCEAVVSYKDVFDHVKQFNLPNINELALTTNALCQDASSVTGKLLEIHDRHKEFSGSVKDGNEMVIHANCGNDYTGLSIQWKSMLFPAMVAMTEYQAEANILVQNQIRKEEAELAEESNQLTPEQDPNVITDVVFKE